MSSSHIILDFKSIRELGMVESSINRGVIQQKIGLWEEGNWWNKSCIQGLFVRDSRVSAILVDGNMNCLWFYFFFCSLPWKNERTRVVMLVKAEGNTYVAASPLWQPKLIENYSRLKCLFSVQRKSVSDSPGLVDFAIGRVNSVFNLREGQVMFFEEFE